MADRQLFSSRHQAASRVGVSAVPGAGVGPGSGAFVRARAPAASSSTAAANTSSTGSAAAPNASAAAGASAATVRRNLFQSQLRRPDDDRRGLERKERERVERIGRIERYEREREREREKELEELENGPVEIIVRDRNGDVVLLDPPSPSADELNEMTAAAPLDSRHESERERQRLADTIKYHQQRTTIPGQPEELELLEALRASLRAKVAALSEDNWMYEPEDMPRVE